MNAKDAELNDRLEEACSLISSYTNYEGLIEPSESFSIINHYKQLNDDALLRTHKISFRLGLVNRNLKSNIGRFQKLYVPFPEVVTNHNEQIASRLAIEIGERINPVESRILDQQQLTAIAYDVRTRLVIAGAGTGKTTTIVGMVKDLLTSGKANTDEILLLSFTNASVDELNKRIISETGKKIETTTFHRLGLKIIASAEGKVPLISRIDIKTFIVDEIKRRRDDPVFLSKLNEYIAFNYDSVRDENSFESGSEFMLYLQENPLYTINGEQVKSFGEADIANYLALNGIPYIYEDTYEVDTRDTQYGQYHPDFHIKDTNIYIEYFGIDRKGNVAKFMTDKNPEAAEEYRKGIEWKREIHKTNGTILIELYAYNRSDGDLIEELENQLRSCNIASDPCPPEEIFDKLFDSDQWKTNALASKFTTAILLIKGFGKSWEEVYPISNDPRIQTELRRMEAVLKPLYDSYQKELMETRTIDFEDMLNIASEHISQGRFIHPYKYVIVDEYQDLSRSRYNLLRSMRQSRDFRLFCVGDDWQSIYRFNGCDVSYILDFESYWGPSALCKIERTYRFSGSLLKKSSEFICRNDKQYKKSLVGSPSKDTGLYPLTASDAMDVRRVISDILYTITEGKSILFLGRYNHDVMVLNGDGFSWKPSISDNSSNITFSERPDLSMRFMTIHSAKGLEADVIFSLNNKTGKYGFPNKRDEPILIPLLLGNDNNQLDEERRLFYVAMTRAKESAFIISISDNQSEFFKEVFTSYDEGGNPKHFEMICPICGGELKLRSGKFGSFYGCSNYNLNGCRFTRALENGK